MELETNRIMKEIIRIIARMAVSAFQWGLSVFLFFIAFALLKEDGKEFSSAVFFFLGLFMFNQVVEFGKQIDE